MRFVMKVCASSVISFGSHPSSRVKILLPPLAPAPVQICFMCLWISLDGPLTAPFLVLGLREAIFLLRQHQRYLFHGYAVQLARS